MAASCCTHQAIEAVAAAGRRRGRGHFASLIKSIACDSRSRPCFAHILRSLQRLRAATLVRLAPARWAGEVSAKGGLSEAASRSVKRGARCLATAESAHLWHPSSSPERVSRAVHFTRPVRINRRPPGGPRALSCSFIILPSQPASSRQIARAGLADSADSLMPLLPRGPP